MTKVPSSIKVNGVIAPKAMKVTIDETHPPNAMISICSQKRNWALSAPATLAGYALNMKLRIKINVISCTTV